MWKRKTPPVSEEQWIYVDDSHYLFERLKQSNHPDYLEWVKRGSPAGMHGLQLYASKFRFTPHNATGG